MERKVDSMMNIDIVKGYRLPISESLRTMRILRCPLDCGDGFLVNDQLESNGFIKVCEFTGTVYIPNAEEIQQFQNNVVPIAGILVSIKEAEQVVQVEKIYCEFGYEEFIAKLMQQVMNFADFYGLKVGIIDMRKEVNVIKKRHCSFVDMKLWEC